MYCTQCGTPRPDGVTVCPACGKPAQQFGGTYQPPPPMTQQMQQQYGTYGAPVPPVAIPNYLVQAILVTLCCCLPGGVVAIVFASQVNTKLAAGDVAGAMESSRNAKMWCWIGFGGGLLVAIGYGVLVGIAGIGGALKS